jgi:hypothetical protein
MVPSFREKGTEVRKARERRQGAFCKTSAMFMPPRATDLAA